MSIPPLVCSTPPPPDQCEEDKDPEDFDIHYNLSQDDDDENYDYGNFSTFNHFETQPSSETIGKSQTIGEQDPRAGKNHIESTPQTLIEPPKELKKDHTRETVAGKIIDSVNEITCEYILKSDEDNNIEDLDLKLEECTTPSNIPIIEESNVNKYDFDITVKDQIVIIPSIDSEVDEQNLNSVLENEHEEEIKSNYGDENEPIKDEIPEFLSVSTTVDGNNDITHPQTDILYTESNKPIKDLEILPDNDFEDFDSFQFTSPKIKSNIIIDNCDNPWEKNVDDDEFGNFTANFDQIRSDYNQKDTAESPNNTTIHKFEEHVQEGVSQDIDEDDDDFGDFDDFKSSNIGDVTKLNISHEEQTGISQQVPVLNLELSDKGHQIVDSVNQVLHSIFLEDIVEPDGEFEYKLESLLSETWGHLIETDVRQPYIVNWNNSLGQKTLLRALCIDSRNILFGPKWSHNTPKYAITLNTAPLQPQKPVLQSSTSQHETAPSERVSNKVDNWTDPFSCGGQQSCNAENEGATVETKPVNIEVFENPMPTKPESLYPNNLSIKPLRQISLPDTHIFTPTDSETPRSKTIHYDTGPTMLLREQHSNNPLTFHSVNSILKPESKTENGNLEDSDDWEFQDFKSTPKLNTTALDLGSEATPVAPVVTPTSDDRSILNKPCQGELLQPIKMTPVLPKLNWPNPGEVNEVFDDFTDFVSNSSWCKESKDNCVEISNNELVTECNPVNNMNDKIVNTHTNKPETTQHSLTDSFDNEFDTFQYALPTQNTSNSYNIDNLIIVKTSRIQCFPPKPLSANQKSNIEEVSSKLNFNISSTNQLKQVTPLTKNMPNVTETSSGKHTLSFNSQSQSNILQPIPATSKTQTHQNTGQILQPLSLESYSQLNWPSPGIDLQDLSKFNPVETLHSFKSDLIISGPNKTASPTHNQRNSSNNQAADDELWGEFVSSKPKPQPSALKKNPTSGDDDEWTDFVSSPNVKPQNGLNTISFNVHTNSNMQKNTYHNKFAKSSQSSIDIPTLNYITPKTNNHKSCNDRHFQNL